MTPRYIHWVTRLREDGLTYPADEAWYQCHQTFPALNDVPRASSLRISFFWPLVGPSCKTGILGAKEYSGSLIFSQQPGHPIEFRSSGPSSRCLSVGGRHHVIIVKSRAYIYAYLHGLPCSRTIIFHSHFCFAERVVLYTRRSVNTTACLIVSVCYPGRLGARWLSTFYHFDAS